MADEEDIGDEGGEMDQQGEEQKKAAAITASLEKVMARSSDPRAVLDFLPTVAQAATDKASCKAFIDAGLITILANALKMHADNVPILIGSCSALSLRNYKYQYDPKAVEEVRASGIISAIISMLKRYPDNRDLQVAGIVALSHIVTGEENRAALEREDGVELVLDSVGRHQIRTSLPF